MQLELWTIYNKPKDFPDHYVARKFLIDKEPIPTMDYFTANTLNEIRLMIPPGLVMMMRDPNDHPNVVETWI